MNCQDVKKAYERKIKVIADNVFNRIKNKMKVMFIVYNFYIDDTS